MSNQEELRIASVKALGILDTAPEPAFDDAVNLAAAICGTPISLITLLDGRRQWFKAKIGLDVCETPQEQAFCAHAIRGQDLFIVPDALLDARFQDNPLVTGNPRIRFYAGMPLRTPEGHALGTLCVIDTVPRQLTLEQRTALTLLSRQVFAQMRMRNQLRGLTQTLAERFVAQNDGVADNALFQAFMDNSPLLGFMKDAQGRILYYNRPFSERFQITREEWIGKTDFELWPPEFAERFRGVDQAVLADDKLVVSEESSPGPDKSLIYWRTYKFPFSPAQGERVLAGMALDVSHEKRNESQLLRSQQELRWANERLREISSATR